MSSRRFPNPSSLLAILCLSVLLPLVAGSATPLYAWPKEAYQNMVYDTIRLLPPSLARVLWRRQEAILLGVSSLEGETASRLARDGRDGVVSSELVSDVETRIDRVVGLVGAHQPFDLMAMELGRLLRIAADLSDPTVMGSGNDDMRRVSAEYHRFVGMHLTEIPLVHDKSLPSTVEGASLTQMLHQLGVSAIASARPLTDVFWKDGRVVSASSFDFRSVPYAQTSLTYSRSVTAASYLWLSAWADANGDFTGYRFSGKSK